MEVRCIGREKNIVPNFLDPAQCWQNLWPLVTEVFLRQSHKGACLFGAVSFEVADDLPGPDACHCSDCRKFSGYFFVSTDVPRTAVTIRGEGNLTWFQYIAR
jgi:hypothetical protein